MIDGMNDTALLNELTEVAERLTARHYETCKPWYPHEFVPWSMGRDFDPDKPWDADEIPLPESLRSALFVNLLTEDNLPYYFQTIDRMFGHARASGANGRTVGRPKRPVTRSPCATS